MMPGYDEQPRERPAYLSDYLGVVRRYKWSIAVILLLCVGGSLALAKTKAPRFTSTAEVLVLQPGTVPVAQSLTQGTQIGKQLNLQTEAQLADSGVVAAIAKES